MSGYRRDEAVYFGYGVSFLYLLQILSLVKIFYRLYKKRIVYTDIPIIYTLIAFFFDIYRLLICVYYPIKQNEEEKMVIVLVMVIIQLIVELALILTFLFYLSHHKISYFILSIVIFEAIITGVYFLLIIDEKVRYIFSITYPITFIGAYESAIKVKYSKNADVIPIEMCICLLIYLTFQFIYYVLYFTFHEIEFFIILGGGFIGFGGNMDMIFQYVKLYQRTIEGTIIKKGEPPVKEKEVKKENEESKDNTTNENLPENNNAINSIDAQLI